MTTAGEVLGANLRRLRRARGVSVVDLARRSGLGRATLTQLEAGGGNPTLETLYALANQLGVALADLIAEADPVPAARVVRSGEGPRTDGATVHAHLLLRHRARDHVVEVHAVTLRGEVVQRSDPHPTGTREHLHLHAGTARVGPADDPVDLAAGDYADYPADVVHVYGQQGGAPAEGTLLIVTPVR